MKKIGFWIVVCLVLGSVLVLTWVRPLQDDQLEVNQAKKTQSPLDDEARESSVVPNRGQIEAKESVTTPLRKWIAAEASLMGATVENPGEIEKRLHQKAKSLSKKEIQTLESLTLNTSVGGDERFLAAELLVMNPTSEAAEALGRIVFFPEARQSSEPTLEKIIRARAIEGLGQHPSPQAERLLQQSLDHISDKALLERGQRALLARKGQVLPPEVQDRAALKKLIEK